MHKVKCRYCGQEFDRDKEKAVKISNTRYIHERCLEKYNGEERDLDRLEEYIIKVLNINYINKKIKNEINSYKKNYNYTYSGMLKSLIYWYEIKNKKDTNNVKNKVNSDSKGVGIIPLIYDEACKYYYNLYLVRSLNEGKIIDKYKPKEKIIMIKPPERKERKIKLFDLEE